MDRGEHQYSVTPSLVFFQPYFALTSNQAGCLLNSFLLDDQVQWPDKLHSKTRFSKLHSLCEFAMNQGPLYWSLKIVHFFLQTCPPRGLLCFQSGVSA